MYFSYEFTYRPEIIRVHFSIQKTSQFIDVAQCCTHAYQLSGVYCTMNEILQTTANRCNTICI